MSTKCTVHYDNETDTHLFEEMSLDDDFESPAYIKSQRFEVNIRVLQDEPATNFVTVEIPAHVMDELAIEWCKKRKLQGEVRRPSWKGVRITRQ